MVIFMIYFDNAATTGMKPPEVIRAVNDALRFYSANPGRSGHSSSVKAAEAVYKVREKAAEFFGASGAEKVCFTQNCTHSINCVLKGVLRRGDHVVVSSLEHNAVMRPLKKTGVNYDIAEVSFYDDEMTLKEFERKIKPNTKIVLCTGASNVLGKTLPIKEIGALCRRKGVLFGVDAAQTAGVVPINMQKMNIDYLCIAPHKGLYAPMGIGMLIAEKDIENTIIEGGTGTNSIELRQPDTLPEKLESGTINLPAVLGTGAGIDYVNRMGVERIHKKELNLIKALYRELEKMSGIVLYTPDPEKFGYAPVLSFNFADKPSTEAAQKLSDAGIAVRGGLHCAPSAHGMIGTLSQGTVRVSVGVFNNLAEINRLLNFCRKIS